MMFRHVCGVTMFLLVIAGVGGCDSKGSAKSDDTEESDDDAKKKKGKKGKGDDKKGKKSGKKGKKSKADPDAKKDGDDKKDGDEKKGGDDKKAEGEVDLDAILGTQSDGFSPRVFAKLKADMSPAEAAAIMPGADVVDEFGFCEIKPTNTPGVHHYKLSYQENKLTFASIIFDESLNTDAFWDKLVAQLKTKLAPVEMKELEPGKKSLMWIAPCFDSITLAEGIVDPGYTLQYSVLE